jgi:hypothetical protein
MDCPRKSISRFQEESGIRHDFRASTVVHAGFLWQSIVFAHEMNQILCSKGTISGRRCQKIHEMQWAFVRLERERAGESSAPG